MRVEGAVEIASLGEARPEPGRGGRRPRRTVVVVGHGNAAFAAAITAREAGAHVVMLEAAPEHAAGGNSRFTLAGFRFGSGGLQDVLTLVPDMSPAERTLVGSRDYTPDDCYATLMTLSRHEADPALARLLADLSFDTLVRMRAWGVRFGLHIFGINQEPMWAASPGNVYAAGRGPGLVAALLCHALRIGVEVRYAHRVEQVIRDADGRVTGVRAVRDCGETVEIDCDSLVMACGGFEANAEMRREHMGEAWAGMKVRGTRYNQGGGITALLDAGAQRAGQWSNGHAVPIAADAPSYGTFELGETTRRCLFQFGVSVNRSARRFMDEGADIKTFMYSMTGLAVASQAGGVAYQIFDSRIDTANFEKEFYRSGTFETAATIPELAPKVGLSADILDAEVRAYNAAVEDDSRFNPAILDGSCAPDLAPPRSNYAARLCRPPYYAFPVTGGITFTYGGVKIDARCRVLDTAGRPIAGVFAAGELAGGFFAHTYPANAGLMRGAVTGRVAGAEAATHLNLEELAP